MNYQTYIWRRSLNGMQRLPPPEGHRWDIEDGTPIPLLMTKDPAPVGLLELTTCSCKWSDYWQNCSCANAGLACTEACECMADESCCNPHGLAWDEDRGRRTGIPELWRIVISLVALFRLNIFFSGTQLTICSFAKFMVLTICTCKPCDIL